MIKRLIVLGSTGSIGTQALAIAAENPGRFEVIGLSAGSNMDLLAKQVDQFKPDRVSVKGEADAGRLASLLSGRKPEILVGDLGVSELARGPADMVISAMVGSVGLGPTLEAVRAGIDVALANKEALVAAGELVLREVEANGIRLLPIDSEHSAVFQSLLGHRREDLNRIVLTASGGPFRGRSIEELRSVTPEQALAHPIWNMGSKITIDSATMMNKGLEVIEAHWLFSVPIERIEVLVHPQGIVHSMVEYCDGMSIAQLGPPDMRGPIAFAMAFPERIEGVVRPVRLEEISPLEFLPVDGEAFPCLGLAYEALKTGGTAPAALNSANEVAVAAFLNREIGFLDIPAVIAAVLDRCVVEPVDSLETVLEADRRARRAAHNLISRR